MASPGFTGWTSHGWRTSFLSARRGRNRMNLEEDQVGVVLLGEYTEIKEGDEVKRTGRIMSVPWAMR